ncbi:MAG: hypothetical protein PHX38_02785 [Sulfuricella sp.]|nr:hypothetical protein [Sulfuricella sp.]
MNKFVYDDKGNVFHYINDELRASVPAAHVDEYRAIWPDCPAPPTSG